MPSVLVVESDEDLREVLVEGLRIEGWTPLAAGDVRGAVGRAVELQVDVVLTDVILARGDGVALELEFRRRRELRHVPFVFMTAYAPYFDQLGPARALLKPFRLEDACRVLRATVAAAPAAASALLRRDALASAAHASASHAVHPFRDRAAAELAAPHTLRW